MERMQIVFTQKNKAELIKTPLPAMDGNTVEVKTVFSTVSCGTERANITGDANVAGVSPAQVSFPRYCGYSSSGIVTDVGAKVTSVKPGDRVVMCASTHSSINVLPEANVIKIEYEDFSLREAALAYISTFPMAAVRKVSAELGESALVMGLGVLGQFSVKLLKAAGVVPVIAADPVAARREEALISGADAAFDPFDKDFAQNVKSASGGGVNIAIEVTGVGAGLNGVLDCMARMGRVALLGCTRDPDFTVDYYRKVHCPGITLIGAHTNARPSYESYPGHFTFRDDIAALMKLCVGKRIDIADMIKETYDPEECAQVYTRLINDREFPTVVQFDWSDTE